jgi:hypothetical protein
MALSAASREQMMDTARGIYAVMEEVADDTAEFHNTVHPLLFYYCRQIFFLIFS